jgi:hypothetical protein
MASIKSVGFLSPQSTPNDGRAVFITDKVVLTANPTVADTLDFRIPAGLEVCSVEIQCDDIDTNASPTFAFGAGYEKIAADSTLSPSLQYFAANGQTTARTGGRLICSFKPITFQEDVFLRLTVGGASATFAAGEIHAIVGGNSKGPR